MDKDKNILIEQYKLYVKTADDITKRRLEINKFYLTILLGLFTISGFLNNTDIFNSSIILILLSILGILLSITWYTNIEAFKQLSSAKFKVIHKMEKELPFKCFDDEWNHLKKGRDKKAYIKLTAIEKYIPLFMMILFIFLLSFTLLN